LGTGTDRLLERLLAGLVLLGAYPVIALAVLVR